MTVECEQDDEVGDGGEDDGGGTESRSTHEELACRDGVAEAGDGAEGQSHGDASGGVTQVADADEAGTAEDEDGGEGEVDGDVVGEEGDGDDEGEADPALAVDLGEGGDRVDEGEDRQHPEAEDDDPDAEEVDGVTEPGELGRHQLVRSLHEEEVEAYLSSHVEDEAQVDGGPAAPLGREVPGVDEEAGGEDEGDGAGVDGQHQDSDGIQLPEIPNLEGFDPRC